MLLLVGGRVLKEELCYLPYSVCNFLQINLPLVKKKNRSC